MKLNEKGIETVFTALLKTIEERDLAFGKNSRDVFKKHIEALEFESDDFDGGCFQNGKDHVVLTVDEVFTLKQMVHFVLNSSRLNNTNKSFLETTYNVLNERFEKAEKGNGIK